MTERQAGKKLPHYPATEGGKKKNHWVFLTCLSKGSDKEKKVLKTF